jgi:hypothetical protein
MTGSATAAGSTPTLTDYESGGGRSNRSERANFINHLQNRTA